MNCRPLASNAGIGLQMVKLHKFSRVLKEPSGSNCIRLKWVGANYMMVGNSQSELSKYHLVLVNLVSGGEIAPSLYVDVLPLNLAKYSAQALICWNYHIFGVHQYGGVENRQIRTIVLKQSIVGRIKVSYSFQFAGGMECRWYNLFALELAIFNHIRVFKDGGRVLCSIITDGDAGWSVFELVYTL